MLHTDYGYFGDSLTDIGRFPTKQYIFKVLSPFPTPPKEDAVGEAIPKNPPSYAQQCYIVAAIIMAQRVLGVQQQPSSLAAWDPASTGLYGT